MPSTSPIRFNEILNSDQAPSLPEVALRIIEVAQKADPDPIELISTVRSDPATAGRVIKFANSALFGLRHKSSSIESAVPMLGTTLVRTLVLGFFLSRQTPSSKELTPWFRRLWREALFQASAAEVLAERTPGADPASWFLAGLLQEIGQLAMLNVAGDEYVEAVLDLDSPLSRVERETEHFGFSHVDVSIALCQKWNLEPQMISAISSHHITTLNFDEAEKRSLATALSTAACCSEYIDAIGSRLNAARHGVERSMIDGYGFLPDEIPSTLAEIDARATELACGFCIDVGKTPSREILLERAQNVLRQIAMESRLQILEGMTSKKPSEDSSEWVDKTTSTYNRRFLDTALPQQLEASHADGASVGLLEVDFTDVTLPEGTDFEQKDFVGVITDCVRPDDCVVCTGARTAVIILQRLNFDVLHRIAERIQTEVNDRLDWAGDAKSGLLVGGVVVMPAGRKVAVADNVLKILTASANKAKNMSSTGIAFQLLTGKKAQVLEKPATV